MLTVNFHPFPELTTERLRLRQIASEDAPALFAIRSDEKVMQFLDRPKPSSINDIHSLIEMMLANLEKNEAISWAICLKEKPQELIGTLVLWHFQKENFRAEIGYMLHSQHHGKKLMSEAVRAVIAYAFTILGLHSLEAIVNPYNKASIRLLEKSGFVREAYFKENYYFNGRFLDSAVYSLVKKLS